jgi:DNA repair/transcription protein MET18/MMS19
MKTPFLQISKAVLVRNHPDFSRISDRFFEVFGGEEISWDAARAIGELGGGDNILTRRNHAVIKVLIYIAFIELRK